MVYSNESMRGVADHGEFKGQWLFKGHNYVGSPIWEEKEYVFKLIFLFSSEEVQNKILLEQKKISPPFFYSVKSRVFRLREKCKMYKT